MKSKGLRWFEHAASICETRDTYRILGEKRPSERPRRRREDSIKMNLDFKLYDFLKVVGRSI